MNVRRLSIPVHDDERGRVVPVEGSELPFVPARSFVICNVPPGKARAGHRMTCDEVLVLVSGSVSVTLRTDDEEASFVLDTPGSALHAREGMWIGLSRFASGTVLLVLASKPYGGRGRQP